MKGESSEAYKLEKLHKAERYLAYAKEYFYQSASKPFVPCKTLLLSADKTYPLHASQIPNLTILSPEECSKRFGGLPPTYGKD